MKDIIKGFNTAQADLFISIAGKTALTELDKLVTTDEKKELHRFIREAIINPRNGEDLSLKEVLEKTFMEYDILQKKLPAVKKRIKENREILKSGFHPDEYILSDRDMDIDFPPVENEVTSEQPLIILPSVDASVIKKKDIFSCINERISRRSFSHEEITSEELSWLLWSTSGVRKTIRDGKVVFKTVPSGGSRHPFETYLAVNHVSGIKPGLYRYIATKHSLEYLYSPDNMKEQLSLGALEQGSAKRCAVCFIWTAVPYRCEWKYTTDAAKLILQDSGHLCQNLYLACESIELGTVAIGAYNQKLMDNFLHIDGDTEMTVYMAPVGRPV